MAPIVQSLIALSILAAGLLLGGWLDHRAHVRAHR
jgi:hypothetical protein